MNIHLRIGIGTKICPAFPKFFTARLIIAREGNTNLRKTQTMEKFQNIFLISKNFHRPPNQRPGGKHPPIGPKPKFTQTSLEPNL